MQVMAQQMIRKLAPLGAGLVMALLLAACSGSSAPVNGGTSGAKSQWVDYNPPALYTGTKTTSDQFITMRDGVRLAVDVTQPLDADGKVVSTPLPVILTLTGYNKGIGTFVPAIGGADPYFVSHGYIQVVVDVRGTGRSEGEWEAFGETEQADYDEVLNWVVAQPWSDDRIGLHGASLLAITAVLTAARQNPAVKAMFPIVPMSDSYRDIVFTGGQTNVGFIPLWLLLVTGLSAIDTTFYVDPQEALQAELSHIVSAVTNFQVPLLLKAVAGDPATAYDGPFWRVRSPVEFADKIKVPTFIVGGLHDIFQRGEPQLYDALKGHTTTKLLIGPWTHVDASMGAGLPADGIPSLSHIALQWFDQYVKGMNVGADNLPNVTQYIWGQGHYVTSSDWPHPQAKTQDLYLHGNKNLSAQKPAADEASNIVLQEPLNGICTASTAQWTAGLLGALPLSCFSDDSLAQTLEVVYDTAPMTEDFYINGPLMANVWISTTSSDAGVVVRVDDADNSGGSFALTNGLLTASMRAVDASRSRYIGGKMVQPWHKFTQDAVLPVGSGNLVELQLEIFPTSALIKKGHSLRISVGASDFPHGLPPLPNLVQQLPGVLKIYSDAAHPSSITVPVVPVSAIH